MRFRAFVAVGMMVASAAVMGGQAPVTGPLFHFTEPTGPYSVGLRVVQQYDFSRTWRSAVDAMGKPYVGERARPIQTLIWYPAEKSDRKPMTVQDYSDLLATETSFDKPELSPDSRQWIDAMTPTLKDSLWAVRDAKAVARKFPLVIYAPSFTSMSWENADLCEYLASHGYVVVAGPDMGANTREMTPDVEGINAQAQDISFLIGYAQTLPDTDMSEIAVAGFSWGGISNLFAAARDNRIRALVALDGSMRYYPGLVKQSGYVHPENMTLPLLFFTQGEISVEDQAHSLEGKGFEGANVLNAWTHGDLITIDDMALVHVEHSSMYQRNEDIWKGYAKNRKGDYSRADGIVGYAWIARYTLEFLDAYLKHDTTAMAFLKKTPAENGVPVHMMTVDFRATKGVPATVETLRRELGQQGFDHAADVYATMKKESPEFKVAEPAMYEWAGELQVDGHLAEAIDVLKLNTGMYPDSSNAYETLGEAYEKAGQKPAAVESYKKALEKDSENRQAKEKLQALEGALAAK
ncbi:MAG TPA: CocE/NonD family hydrolase [Granulicella sp.]